jgi:hypothetical protein
MKPEGQRTHGDIRKSTKLRRHVERQNVAQMPIRGRKKCGSTPTNTDCAMWLAGLKTDHVSGIPARNNFRLQANICCCPGSW